MPDLFGMPRRVLHAVACLLATAVLVLICSGGLVTSHEAGMAVPDWPNSFGYNMFLFPVSHWVGGVLFEHTHRLIASGVGLLTLAFCGLTLKVEDRRWVKQLAGLAVLAVILQGVLGGLRVTAHNQVLGLLHGCLAQSYLSLVAVLALVTSRFWLNWAPQAATPAVGAIRQGVLFVTAMVFVQLVLGASMRHSHAGLAIHDFPTVYGGVLPPLDAGSLERINQARGASGTEPFTSSGLILLQYVHRIWAVAVTLGIFCIGAVTWRQRELPALLRRLASTWVLLVTAQFVLGAWTIWSNKAADVATGHVLLGALTLVTGVLFSVTLVRLGQRAAWRRSPISTRLESLNA
ncbi:MAG TPA: COX15/CtaA family protein [Chthoniobacterales bacterium]